MKAKVFTVFCFLVFITQKSFAQTDAILNRYGQYLLQAVKVESNVKQLAATLNANGQWDDINYSDTEPANWKPLIHLKRAKDLALAWSNPKSSFYHQTAIKRCMDAALDHWLKTRYKSSNWWHNQIGVPQQIRDIIVLMQDDLSSEQLKGALEILAQYHVYGNATGANLTWSADLGFHYGVLTGDTALMQKCRNLMVNEIKVSTDEGVQPDYSFHQHGNRLQMYQYGKAFFWENVRIAWELRNTAFAFPQNKIDILSDFILQGWQWMARGIHTVPGTMDRSASRKNELHAADIRPLVPYLIELMPGKRDSLDNISKNQNGSSSLSGFRYFPYSDFVAYHQRNFSFFLKTISDRTLATESINHENLKGHLLNSGDAYLISDGKEYYNLMPVWNWEYLPGVTSFDGADKIKRLPFAGSVSDGTIGLTAMDYFLQDKKGERSISAKKSWFCFDDKVVCLVAGLKGNNVDSAYTALDQCRWRGDVVVNAKNLMNDGDHLFSNCKWIYHSGFAYMPIGEARVNVQMRAVTGSWQNINKSETNELIREKIFMPVLLHDQLSSNKSFAYILANSKDKKQAGSIFKNPAYKIIQNDTTCQAVLFTGNILFASFFKPSSIHYNNMTLSVNKPCLLIIKKDRLYASDPLQKGEVLLLKFNNKNYNLKLNEHGFSTEEQL